MSNLEWNRSVKLISLELSERTTMCLPVHSRAKRLPIAWERERERRGRREGEKSRRFSRSLRDTVLHTLHLQQTAGDPRRSLSSRLLSTSPLPFSPPASLFCLCPVSLSLFLPAVVRQYLRFVRRYEPRFPTKDAFRSTIPEKKLNGTASAVNSSP